MKLKEVFEQLISDNTCIHCGTIVDENLRKWFKDRWVNIGKKKRGHPPCGTSGKKRGYFKCVPTSKDDQETKRATRKSPQNKL